MRSIQSVPGYDVPQVVEVDDLRPGPGQVLIQVAAAAVNPVDVFAATETGRGCGRRRQPDRPRLGRLRHGRRDRRRGRGPLGRRPGRRCRRDMVGAFRAQADLAVLDAEAVALVPAGLDLVSAASIPLNVVTAHQALALLGEPPDASLVTGAGGAVGGYAAALAAAGRLGRDRPRPPQRRGVRAVHGRSVRRARRAGVVRLGARRRRAPTGGSGAGTRRRHVRGSAAEHAGAGRTWDHGDGGQGTPRRPAAGGSCCGAR